SRSALPAQSTRGPGAGRWPPLWPGAFAMIEAASFLTAAQERGFRFFTGVPCSFLTPLINQAIGNEAFEYLGAANEGEAVAIAAGAWLAGSPSLVMCQNSGLGNTVNALTSLN